MNLRFHARGPVKVREVDGCRGKRRRQPGVWNGLINFTAMNGFTAAFATQARGKVITGQVTCFVDAEPGAKPGDAGYLQAFEAEGDSANGGRGTWRHSCLASDGSR